MVARFVCFLSMVLRMAGSDSKLSVSSRLVRLQIELFAFVSSGITIVYLYISM